MKSKQKSNFFQVFPDHADLSDHSPASIRVLLSFASFQELFVTNFVILMLACEQTTPIYNEALGVDFMRIKGGNGLDSRFGGGNSHNWEAGDQQSNRLIA
jgi:hypothetical protein